MSINLLEVCSGNDEHDLHGCFVLRYPHSSERSQILFNMAKKLIQIDGSLQG